MNTEIRDGQRVWTKEAIGVILEGYNQDRPEDYWEKISQVLEGGLLEAGFTSTTKATKNKRSFSLETGAWVCYIHLLQLDDGTIRFLVGLSHYPVEDLIYLWDYIRSSWEMR